MYTYLHFKLNGIGSCYFNGCVMMLQYCSFLYGVAMPTVTIETVKNVTKLLRDVLYLYVIHSCVQRDCVTKAMSLIMSVYVF